MNIQQVIYAVEVYEHHSFTEAAKSLFISQPRLSQAIRELEEELGFELFTRSNKGISSTTVKGFEFIEQARVLIRQFNELENLKDMQSSSFHLCSTLMSQAQDAFLALSCETISDPHLNMNMWFCGCFEAAERIRSTASDVGVVTIIDDQFEEWMYYFRSNGIEYHEITSSRAYVTVSKDSPLTSKKIVHKDDLAEYTYIAEKCSRMNDLTIRVYATLDKICPETRITVSNTDMMYTLASQTARSRTFVFDPIPPAKSTLDRYGLVSIPFEDAFFGHIGYLTRANIRLNHLGERYVELLKEALRERS